MSANDPAVLSIGDFSRATHLSVKMLRHYHQLGLLEPVEVDPQTGYRRYTVDQIPAAQVIGRFRALEMPLEEIREIISASDLATRNARIANHLERLEDELGRTQRAVSTLRRLLEPPATRDGQEVRIELLKKQPTLSAAITATVDVADAAAWFRGALGELYATLDAQRIPATGRAGGVYADEIFTEHRGEATVFVPCERPVRPLGRVVSATIPAVELAVIEHVGPLSEVDRSYGLLATHVARNALAVAGPLREYYTVGMHDTADEAQWLTEVCWPVFHTGG
ncbi:MerR family transcriptional regulator [Actinospica robiniae]|uniref:MerR family transcriptional regulator n=1 Tax=Actinospica robiniae TaxID=304901 RepID=UPI0003FAB21F|nr:MerR family transcriptional regulator [Actinospica robiniae]